MIPAIVYKILDDVIVILGSVAAILGLFVLVLVFRWKILEYSARGKRWHQYIKEHKEDFIRWGLKKNKEV